jgi:hypothetical protein
MSVSVDGVMGSPSLTALTLHLGYNPLTPIHWPLTVIHASSGAAYGAGGPELNGYSSGVHERVTLDDYGRRGADQVDVRQ